MTELLQTKCPVAKMKPNGIFEVYLLISPVGISSRMLWSLNDIDYMAVHNSINLTVTIDFNSYILYIKVFFFSSINI